MLEVYRVFLIPEPKLSPSEPPLRPIPRDLFWGPPDPAVLLGNINMLLAPRRPHRVKRQLRL